MIYLVFTLMCFIFWGAYYLFNKDFFSPGMIYIESFLLASLMAVIYKNEWGVNYEFQFFALIIGVMIIFLFFAYLIKYVKKRVKVLHGLIKKTNRRQIKPIHLHIGYLTFFLLLSIIGVCLYFREVYRIAKELGNTNGVSGMFYVYHNKYLLSAGKTNVKVNSIIELLNRINMIFAYYFSYVFCNNCFRYKEKLARNVPYLFFAFIYMIGLFIGSQRTGIIYLLFSILFMAFIITRQNHNWKQADISTLKIVFFSLMAVVVLACGLKWLGELMGRTNHQNAMHYFAGYLGGGIPNIARFLQNHKLCLLSECMGAADINTFWSYLGVRCNLSTWLSGSARMGLLKYIFYAIIVSCSYAHFYYAYLYKCRITSFSDYILVVYGYAVQGLLFVGLTDIIISHMMGMGYLFFCIMVWFLDGFCRLKSKN